MVSQGHIFTHDFPGQGEDPLARLLQSLVILDFPVPGGITSQGWETAKMAAYLFLWEFYPSGVQSGCWPKCRRWLETLDVRCHPVSRNGIGDSLKEVV